MKIFVTSFQLPKEGNAPEECEDAFYPEAQGERHETIFRIAVADGASEGILCGKWAGILARTFCENKDPGVEPALFLERACKEWHDWRKAYFQEREKRNRPVQWYEEPGLQSGAFSTFLGLTLTGPGEKESGQWEAAALGDSCLFQIRSESLVAALPVKSSKDFSGRPLLISSNPALNKKVLEDMCSRRAEWQTDDCFYLMTDALACWFLKEHELGRRPWQTLTDLKTSEQHQPFAEWIAHLRKTRQMRNDDVTLIRIDMM